MGFEDQRSEEFLNVKTERAEFFKQGNSKLRIPVELTKRMKNYAFRYRRGCPMMNPMCPCPTYENGCFVCKCLTGSNTGASTLFGGGFQPGVMPGGQSGRRLACFQNRKVVVRIFDTVIRYCHPTVLSGEVESKSNNSMGEQLLRK
ncbi:hypothetical protein CHS0354_009497 [Potamilus streckersoni]|uniref:Uncharacterized protein n=1 Tax=Potamilus streckersoni TaxID=2493646 RepID=A0AAE0RVU2_9BIVA|nr:hypothetical protein CHS0354_009497 [Potamilus streckersoni]